VQPVLDRARLLEGRSERPVGRHPALGTGHPVRAGIRTDRHPRCRHAAESGLKKSRRDTRWRGRRPTSPARGSTTPSIPDSQCPGSEPSALSSPARSRSLALQPQHLPSLRHQTKIRTISGPGPDQRLHQLPFGLFNLGAAAVPPADEEPAGELLAEEAGLLPGACRPADSRLRYGDSKNTAWFFPAVLARYREMSASLSASASVVGLVMLRAPMLVVT
jgi:hypothetical protein